MPYKLIDEQGRSMTVSDDAVRALRRMTGACFDEADKQAFHEFHSELVQTYFNYPETQSESANDEEFDVAKLAQHEYREAVSEVDPRGPKLELWRKDPRRFVNQLCDAVLFWKKAAVCYWHIADWFATHTPGTPVPDWVMVGWPIRPSTVDDIEEGFVRQFQHTVYEIREDDYANEEKPKFGIREVVMKHTGDYNALGEVVGVYLTRKRKIRYVVEHALGFQHIYSEANLRPATDEEQAEWERLVADPPTT